jgi:hypothetical protein
MLQADKHR